MKWLLLFLVGCAAPSYNTLPSDGIVQVWWSDHKATVVAHPELIRLKKILERTGR